MNDISWQKPQISCFGELPSRFLKNGYLSNPADLLWTREVYTLLRRLGMKEAEIGEQASDYERFCALCRAIPFLMGHSLPKKCDRLLSRFFGEMPHLAEQNADAIWKAVTEHLSQTPRRALDCLSEWNGAEPSSVCISAEVLSQVAPVGIRPVLNGTTLPFDDVGTWGACKERFLQTLDVFEQMGGKAVFFQMNSVCCTVTPDLYHVEQALKGSLSHREREAYLSAQSLRFLCEEAQKRSFTLLLSVDADAEAAVRALQTMRNTVGLPELVWYADSLSNSIKLLQRLEQAQLYHARCALPTHVYPNEEELCGALQALASRYPVGELTVLCGGDLRFADFERARFERAWERLCHTL